MVDAAGEGGVQWLPSAPLRVFTPVHALQRFHLVLHSVKPVLHLSNLPVRQLLFSTALASCSLRTGAAAR